MRKLSAVIGMIALAMYASADVRNIRPPVTGEGKLGTTTYKWGEVNAVNGYYSNLILGDLNITNKFISPYDGEAGEVFYANGLGGGVWGAASSPTNGISQAVAESLFATVAQGAKADAALPKDGSSPMTGDLDMDGYDIADAGIIHADSVELITPSRSYAHNMVLPLYTTIPTKQGYFGSNDDFFGATNGVGFFCVDADNAANFPLTYLSTNNYIKIKCPGISLTSNYISKITGYGTCTDNNSPVAGLLVGDNYITFNYETNYVPRVAATFAKFGSPIATITPDTGSEYKATALIEISYVQSTASARIEYGKSFVFMGYTSPLSTLSSQSRVIPIIYSYSNPDSGVEISYKGNKLIYFNSAGYQASFDNAVVLKERINITALITASNLTVTQK